MNSPSNRASKPRLLAIDCATLPASVAVLGVGHEAIEIVHDEHQRADAWVGTAVQACLQQTDLDLDDIDGFAACIGPGTFTGIRVGIATALGLAAPRALPVCGVRSLDALALLGSSSDATPGSGIRRDIRARRQTRRAAAESPLGADGMRRARGRPGNRRPRRPDRPHRLRRCAGRRPIGARDRHPTRCRRWPTGAARLAGGPRRAAGLARCGARLHPSARRPSAAQSAARSPPQTVV